MAKSEAVSIYIGTYPNEAAAQADYAVVKVLHALEAVRSYDAPPQPAGAAVGAVSGNTIEQAVDKAALKAEKQVAKELNVKPKDIDNAIEEAVGEVS